MGDCDFQEIYVSEVFIIGKLKQLHYIFAFIKTSQLFLNLQYLKILHKKSCIYISPEHSSTT